ncbi:MAG: hypothetical protein JSV62_10060 [Promethearchaeota archaeon]|nr:MAG: hypothetical protein JSV62_10060 [Candidatus Lokiarchaeota archaeon]
MIFDPLERFFSSMSIFLLFICSITYFSRGFKRDKKNEKILMFGFGVYWLNIALTRIFFYISDYILEGTYTGDLSVILYTYDVGNYILLYFYLFLYIYIFLNATIIMVIFIWFSFKTKHELQAISSIMTIGLIIFLIGWSLESIFLRTLDLFTPAIGSIFIIIGVLITLFPIIGHFELFSRPFIRGFIIIMLSILMIFVVLTLLLNLQLVHLFLVIIWIAIFAIIIIIGYIIYFYSKRREPESKKEELKDTLRLFTKPLKFSVEDIKYSKEKGFCLVCKNKISGLTYVCSKCEAWYCINCCKALTELENNCWGCDTPFIEFKSKKNKKE